MSIKLIDYKSSTSPVDGSCGSCVYWEKVADRTDDGFQDEGLCRRNAPIAVGHTSIRHEGESPEGILGLLAAWPRTFDESDWCGEYKAVTHLAGRFKPGQPE